MVNFFSPNVWQMMTFMNSLDALIPKIPFPFFADFWVWVTSQARASVSVGFWGSRQLSPFGGGLARGLYPHPPPPKNVHISNMSNATCTASLGTPSAPPRRMVERLPHFFVHVKTLLGAWTRALS